jgi:peptidoglycan/xylan/chitin deacetylase (PgdA/CDA1 family)
MRRRDFAALLLERSGLGGVLRVGAAWRGLLVLCYHRILEGDRRCAGPGRWSATQDQLDEQLRLLNRYFEVVAPSDLLDGPALRDRRLVAVTFDDGYRDNHALALPVLRAHGVRAGFFVPTGYVDRPHAAWWDEIAWMVRSSGRPGLPTGRWLTRPLQFDARNRHAAIDALTDVYKRLPGDQTEPFLDFLAEATGSGRRDPAEAADDWMTWGMLRELCDAGMDIGGHTVNHPVLARLDRDQQQAEIEGCRRRLRDELGVAMKLFAYPVGLPGSFDGRTRDCLASAGVELAFSLHGGYTTGIPWDRYGIRRTSVAVSNAVPANFRATVTLPQVFARW